MQTIVGFIIGLVIFTSVLKFYDRSFKKKVVRIYYRDKRRNDDLEQKVMQKQYIAPMEIPNGHFKTDENSKSLKQSEKKVLPTDLTWNEDDIPPEQDTDESNKDLGLNSNDKKEEKEEWKKRNEDAINKMLKL